MNKKNEEALQKLFFEMPDTINLEDLMEVKGGGIDPPTCPVAGSGVCPVAGSGVCPNGGA